MKRQREPASASRRGRHTRWLVAALAVQLALVGVVAAPRLSPRLFGDEYLVRVQPVDPTDPFRGAYVDLGYGLAGGYDADEDVWVELAGESPHELRNRGSRRPSGPAIRCHRDEGEFDCGIHSFFASQDEAKRLEEELSGGGAVARIRIDGAGRAAIVGLE